MRPILLGLIALTIVACTSSDQPNFASMTDEELAIYNSTVSLSERVSCIRVKPSMIARHVRRMKCGTVDEIGQTPEYSSPGPQNSQHDIFSMDRYRNRGQNNP